MKHFNPRLLIPVVLILVFGIGGWYIDARRARQRSVLSGFFESQPTQVASRIEGRIARLLVKEGDAVPLGQSLLEMEAAPAREEAVAKQAAAEQAQHQLREAQNGPRPEDIRKQEAVVAEATANLARLRNGPLPEDIAGARARVAQAEANYRKLSSGARPQEIEQARAVEQNAKARLRQAERGLTAEEKAQAKARLDATIAAETLARQEAERMAALLEQGAISRQQWDRTRADLREATAKRQESEAAWRQAEAGTPAEELTQVREAYQQAKAGLDLVLAGARKEDIEAASAEVTQTREALKLLLSGTRREDIQAGEARLAQAQAGLDALRAGSRKEQIAQLEDAAKAAQAQAKSSQTNLNERVVRAPHAGVVERILVAEGDLVGARTPVVRMSNPQDIWLRVYIPEASLANVHLNDEAVLRVDGVAETIITVVENIATQGEFTPANLQTPNERGKQVFAVRLRLKQPDPRIKAGMLATVTQIGSWKP